MKRPGIGLLSSAIAMAVTGLAVAAGEPRSVYIVHLTDPPATQFDSMQQVIHVRNGKGGRERLVPMPSKLYRLLRAYYKHERPPRPWLFTAKKGKPLCRTRIVFTCQPCRSRRAAAASTEARGMSQMLENLKL